MEDIFLSRAGGTLMPAPLPLNPPIMAPCWAITVVIADHVLLPEEEGYLNTYELRNRKTGRLFTDLQQYVTIELPKLPDQDDGQPLWPQLRFLKCKAEEEMAMLIEKHPEVRPLVAEYKRMTIVERLRKRAEHREKQRRDEWAALEYAKDEGREEGQNQILELMKQGYTTEQIEAKLAGNSDSRSV